jgi:hypothetical protein
MKNEIKSYQKLVTILVKDRVNQLLGADVIRNISVFETSYDPYDVGVSHSSKKYESISVVIRTGKTGKSANFRFHIGVLLLNAGDYIFSKKFHINVVFNTDYGPVEPENYFSDGYRIQGDEKSLAILKKDFSS